MIAYLYMEKLVLVGLAVWLALVFPFLWVVYFIFFVAAHFR